MRCDGDREALCRHRVVCIFYLHREVTGASGGRRAHYNPRGRIYAETSRQATAGGESCAHIRLNYRYTRARESLRLRYAV